MLYEEGNAQDKVVFDEGITEEFLGIIESLLGKKLDLKFSNPTNLFEFMNNPEAFIADKETVEEIKSLKDLISVMGGMEDD